MKALLLDLDDTLLGNPMDRFVPAYFDGLARWVSAYVERDQLIRELLAATRAMQANDGDGQTNEEVFAAHFYPALGYERRELEPVFDQFYREAFPALRALTTERAGARELVDWAFARDLEVVIATNPLFPAIAIEERLAWAGVPVTQYPYRLVTTYENMHATKDSPAYYREILGHLTCTAQDCLMVGDSWDWDVVQACVVGMKAYWITSERHRVPNLSCELIGYGGVEDCLRTLQAAF